MSIIEGRNVEILQSIIDGKPYENTNPYPSRIEQLLMELKEVIEQGDDAYTKAETDELLDGKADIVNGVIPISQIPPAAIEKEVPVADDAARFALTTADVQLGYTVRVVATNKMYLVVDTEHLDTEAGYQVYVAGRAAEAVADQYGNTIDTTYATKTDVDASQAAQDTRIDWLERNIETIRVMMDAVLYGYRVDKNDSNPGTRVSYMYDAVGMTPARMNYTAGVFDYGSWANAWFITGNKPVALKFDGTVDYELDPDDYTKKADGTESDVSDSAYEGNFMASMPTVWFKRWEDDNYEYVAISNKQIAPDFYADAHDNGEGDINDMIYLPMFKGVTIGGKLRSIAGAAVEGNTSGSEEKARAEANGTGWQLWDWSKHELVSDLLTLISRSSNSQAAFGQGDISTYVNDASQNYGKLNTGQHKVDGEWVMYGGGRFWGASDDKHHVKVFHIEDFWGNRWDRCLGLNLVNIEYVYKMVRPYSLDTDSTYTHSGLTAPTSGYQKTQYAGRFGTLPKAVGGSQTTYVCDYFWSISGTRLAFFGGSCFTGANCGSRCLDLYAASSHRYWDVGGSLCFNHPHEGV